MHRRLFISGLLALGLPALPAWLAASERDMYTVKKGDTLSGIARTYKVTVRELKASNGLRGDLIKIGQKLRIPGRGDDDLAWILSGVAVDRARWRYIVGHHSATPYGNAEIYDRNHRRRGMTNGLAYHFVIGNGRDSGDGQIEIGPRWTQQLNGGHVRSAHHNEHGIGICLVGNFEETRPTTRQIAAFTDLVDFLGFRVLNNRFKFMVHKEVDRNHTVCPGRNFPLRQLKARYP
jgi:LysM repeat protein